MARKFPEIAEWSRISRLKLSSVEDQKFVYAVLGSKVGVDIISQSFQDERMQVAILDDDVLFHAMLELAEPLPISPELYFYVLIRRALLKQVIGDVEVANYITALLSYRVKRAELLSSRNNVFYVSDALQAIQDASSDEQFYLRVQLANQALFLTGLFGEYIRFRMKRRGAPSIGFYEAFAETQYQAAAPHPLSGEFGLEGVFVTLGASLAEVRKALNLFADQFVSLGEPFIDDGK